MLGGKSLGIPFSAFVSSANASAGVLFSFFNGQGTGLTVTTKHQVVIESYSAITAAGGDMYIKGGANGNILRRGTFAANGGMAGSMVELVCYKGQTPLLYAPVGQVDAQIEGRLFLFQ